MSYELHRGDCLEVLSGIPDASVDSIVTDPPYGLNFMAQRWDCKVPRVEVWVQCLRVLKPGGHLLAFAGTRTQHRMAVRIEDAGFEIRDMIAWVYGSGLPKSHNGEWGGTTLKPALEPITMARKPLDGTVASTWAVHGTGGLNIGGCRIEARARADYGLSNSMRSFANTYGAPSASAEFDASKGRWPANLIHDGSDEVFAQFPVTGPSTGGGMSRDGKSNNVYGKQIGHSKVQNVGYGDAGSAARFFYCAKASKADRGAENNHPTVKPTDLMAYLCRLVTPPGGVVLDPFMGSGSTGKACMREGFRFIGIDLDDDGTGKPLGYIEIARARLEHQLQCSREAASKTGNLDLFEVAK